MRSRQVAKQQRHVSLRLVLVVLIFTYILYALLRPISAPLSLKLTLPQEFNNTTVSIPWPSDAQAAYGAVGYGILATHNTSTPTPTASVAKLITALSVLSKLPLASGETGPTITFTASDVAIYNNYYKNGGSSVPVTIGEQMTEYQALQAMMLPSANNIADSLAIDTFGSLPAYVTYASQYVKALGMTHTTVSDASGFSPHTTSTADDLILLGQAALQNPTLAQIVGQSKASSPSGELTNVNTLLGTDGIVGIKTGNTDLAGGVFLGAATTTIDSHPLTIITAIMHSPNLATALSSTLPLVRASGQLFSTKHPLKLGDVVGTATTPWDTSVNITAKSNVSFTAWNGSSFTSSSTTHTTMTSAPADTTVGAITIHDHSLAISSDIVLANTPASPGIWWRLTHPITHY